MTDPIRDELAAALRTEDFERLAAELDADADRERLENTPPHKMAKVAGRYDGHTAQELRWRKAADALRAAANAATPSNASVRDSVCDDAQGCASDAAGRMPVASASAGAGDSFAWLIEMRDVPGVGNYWGDQVGRGIGFGIIEKAVRFARKEDAEAVMRKDARLREMIADGCRVEATEHAWIPAAPSQPHGKSK